MPQHLWWLALSLAVLLSVVTALVRGGHSYHITVGSANVLAIGKATQTPGGFPGITQAALATHNRLEESDDKPKTRSVWIQGVLELLMADAAGPRITLLALQEIDLPLHKGLVVWKRKHTDFQFLERDWGPTEAERRRGPTIPRVQPNSSDRKLPRW